MSIDADVEAAEHQDVEALGRELGEAIADLPVYERFADAKAAVEADEAAQAKIAEFEELREEFAMARQIGQADQDDLAQLQEAQEELHSMPVMERYLEAQSELTARLEAVNDAVSDPLAVDFGQQAGGCCEDEE